MEMLLISLSNLHWIFKTYQSLVFHLPRSETTKRESNRYKFVFFQLSITSSVDTLKRFQLRIDLLLIREELNGLLFPMTNTTLVKCNCDRCNCEISVEEAIEKNDKYYCCQACANGHENDDSCKMSNCNCGD